MKRLTLPVVVLGVASLGLSASTFAFMPKAPNSGSSTANMSLSSMYENLSGATEDSMRAGCETMRMCKRKLTACHGDKMCEKGVFKRFEDKIKRRS